MKVRGPVRMTRYDFAYNPLRLERMPLFISIIPRIESVITIRKSADDHARPVFDVVRQKDRMKHKVGGRVQKAQSGGNVGPYDSLYPLGWLVALAPYQFNIRPVHDTA